MKGKTWFVAAAVMGTLFFGCKAKEQTAEAPPPEQPKAEAPAQPKAEAPATAPATTPAQPEAAASAPAVSKQGYDRALLRASMLKDKAPETFHVKFVTTRGDFVVTVNRSWAPIGADPFYNLVSTQSIANPAFFPVVTASLAQI